MENGIDQLLESAFQEAGKIDKAAAKSNIYIQIAEVYLKYRDKSHCLEVLEEAVKTAGSLKRPEEKAVRLAWIGRIYQAAGEISMAQEQFSRAILLARAAETVAQHVDGLYHIACEYADAGLNDEVVRALSELHEIVINPESEVDAACELIKLADIYADIGLMDKANEILEETLKISAGLKDNWFKTERLTEIAETFADMGKAVDSLRILMDARTVLSLINETNRPYFLLRMVDVYLSISHKSEASQLLTEIQEIASREELLPAKINDLIEIAWRYADLEDISTIALILKQVGTINDGLEDIKDRVNNLLEISRLWGMMKQKGPASEAAYQALDLAKTLRDKKSIPYVLGNIAVVFTGIEDQKKAAEIVSLIVQNVEGPYSKTAGLGAIVTDLAESGESPLALSLARIIREPEAKASALISISESLFSADHS